MHKIVVMESQQTDIAVERGWQPDQFEHSEDSEYDRSYRCPQDNRWSLEVNTGLGFLADLKFDGTIITVVSSTSSSTSRTSLIPRCDDLVAADIGSALQTFDSLAKKSLKTRFETEITTVTSEEHKAAYFVSSRQGNGDIYAKVILAFNVSNNQFEVVCWTTLSGAQIYPMTATRAIAAQIMETVAEKELV